VKALNAWLDAGRRTKPWRAWDRYGAVRGNVLAGGIAYFAFFSLLPALALGFTVLGLVVGDRADLQDSVVDYVNTTFGGATVIGRTDAEGIVSIHRLTQGDVLSATGIGGLVVLLFTGLGWIGALRDAVSAVFQRVNGPNPVAAKGGDLVALLSFGLAALASMAGSVLVTSATGLVLDWLGLGRSPGTGVLVNVLTSVLLLAVDTALFLVLFWLLAGVELPWDDVFTGALAGGVAFGLLKLLGGLLLRLASQNRFLAAFSIVVGLLIWMNLAARLGLLASAWAATTAEDRGHLPPLARPIAGTEGTAGTAETAGVPAGATPSGGAGAVRVGAGAVRVGADAVRVGVSGTPTYSTRAGDRTTVAAGAVLGLTAALLGRVLAGAVGDVRGALRRRDRDAAD
jgi:membrane protein